MCILLYFIHGPPVFSILGSAYVDDSDVLVYDTCAVARNYLRSWFLIDFLSCIPYEYLGLLIIEASGGQGEAGGGDLGC